MKERKNAVELPAKLSQNSAVFVHTFSKIDLMIR
jgi:hypothetical protein